MSKSLPCRSCKSWFVWTKRKQKKYGIATWEKTAAVCVSIRFTSTWTNHNPSCNYFSMKQKRNLSILALAQAAIHPRFHASFMNSETPPKKVGFVRLGGLQAHGSVWLQAKGVVTENEPCCLFLLAIVGHNFQGKFDSSLSTRSNWKKIDPRV